MLRNWLRSGVVGAGVAGVVRRLGTATGRKRLVIVGTGWGGYALAKAIDKKKWDVSVVSPRNHMLFTPLLASTTTGTLEYRSIIQPVREIGFRQGDDFHLANVTDVDAEGKTVTVAPAVGPGAPYELAYDALVLAVGSQPNTFGMDGVEEHAFFLKELTDARKIRDRLLDNLEEATGALAGRLPPERREQLLNVVVVGGGPTGIEFAGELYDLVMSDMRRLYPSVADKLQISLVAGAGVLSAFHSSLRAYAEKQLRARPQLRLEHQNVTAVDAGSVTIDDGTVIPSALTVWAAGIGPRPLTSHLAETRNFPLLSRRFRVDSHLALAGHDSIFALGDCAAIEDNVHPQTAQVAETQAYYVADVLNNLADGIPPAAADAYHFQSKGALAYLGGFRAISDFSMASLNRKLPPEGSEPSAVGTLAGFHSWLVWRSAYLTKLGSWRARFQVPADWAKTLIFGRDLSRFAS